MNTPKKMISLLLFCFILMLPLSTPAGTMPDTGQTQCYNNENEIACPEEGADFYGQDGQYTGPARSYTKVAKKGVALPDTATVADGWLMTRDNTTGLMWEMKKDLDNVGKYADPHDADNQYTWYDSNAVTNGGSSGTPGDGTDTEDFIHALNSAKFGGFTDWRMPTVKELASLIINDGTRHPAVDYGFFPNTEAHCYWSSTTDASDPNNAWGMDFDDGDDSTALKGVTRYVRAVRGGLSGAMGNAIVSGRMVDNQDGTVTDSETGLMWQQATGTGTYTWQGALAHVEETLSLAGHSDWRLPNCNELRTLTDYMRLGPATDPIAFPDTATTLWYWSSTTETSDPVNAWGVNFNTGSQWNYFVKTESAYVRAVRGVQTGPLDSPAISQGSLTGHPGTKFVRTGDGFTPNSTAIFYFNGPGTVGLLTQNQAIGADGSFEIVSSFPVKACGTFSWWAEDGVTGRWSNVVIYDLSCPPTGPLLLMTE